MDVVWVYDDGGILILPLLHENAPTFIANIWESLGCSIFLSFFIFLRAPKYLFWIRKWQVETRNNGALLNGNE